MSAAQRQIWSPNEPELEDILAELELYALTVLEIFEEAPKKILDTIAQGGEAKVKPAQ